MEVSGEFSRISVDWNKKILTQCSDAPSGSVDLDNARRAQPTTTPGVSERNAPRGYLPVIGGFIKRDVPPDGWIRHEDPEKRAIFPTLIKREVPPEKVTSTKWITTDDCKPSPSPSAHPEEDDEECEDEEHEHDWDYSLRYDATSSGKLAQATSSPAPEGAPYSHQPGPSDAPHVGEFLIRFPTPDRGKRVGLTLRRRYCTR